MSHSRRATLIDLEPDGTDWPDTGVNVQIMHPGQPNCRYVHYPVNEVAAKYDASVKNPTDEPAEAYADWRREPGRALDRWPLPQP